MLLNVKINTGTKNSQMQVDPEYYAKCPQAQIKLALIGLK